MNDEYRDAETSAIFAEWSAPAPSDGFHSRVESAFEREFGGVPWWRRALAAIGHGLWRHRLAEVGVVAIGFFAMQFQSVGSPPAAVPWTVDSEFVSYGLDGSRTVEMISTSYEANSSEVLVSRAVPGNVFLTALGRVADAALPAWGRLITPFVVDPAMVEKRRRAQLATVGFLTGCNAGCTVLEHYGFVRTAGGTGCIEGSIAGRETILGHATEAVQRRWMEHGRMTLWMAPDLGCFALRVTHEEPRADGSFRMVKAKQAVRVNLSPH